MGKFLFALWLIDPQIGKLHILLIMNLSKDIKIGACQFEGVCLICCGVQAIFHHNMFIPDRPLQQSGIFLMV